MVKLITLIFVVFLVKVVAEITTTKDDPKVVIKHSIAYHSIRNIRAVELELFVTRKIDTSPMLRGIEQIQKIRDRVAIMCKKITFQLNSPPATTTTTPKPSVPKFRRVAIQSPVTKMEAAARCQAEGLQLPEVYTADERYQLIELMRRHHMSVTHAGIEWDLLFTMHRFMATGYPAWQALQKTIYAYDGKQLLPRNWVDIAHQSEIRFFYTKNGDLACYYEDTAIARSYQFTKTYWTYPEYQKLDEFATIDLVCQTKWNGSYIKENPAPAPWTYAQRIVSDDTLKIAKTKRDLRMALTNTSPVSPLEELCSSVTEHLTETFERSQYRLISALKQADISLEGQLEGHDIDKRSEPMISNATDLPTQRNKRGIGSVVFKSGLKNIWSLLGFIEKVRTRRRLGKLEKEVSKQRDQIAELTKEVSNQSISIAQLTLVTQDLSNRLSSLTYRVDELENKVGALGAEIRVQQLLQLLDSLIGRTDQALVFAFGMLESIVQSALIGQTSAFLLPADQLATLQVEVNKYSSAIVDTAYDRMRTALISDPLAIGSLTCFVYVYAMSRNANELVELIAIPSYQGILASVPKLDYTTVLWDQEGQTYTPIDPSEVKACLEDKCICSNAEMSTTSRACGIPQYYSRHLASCLAEDISSNGMFLKSLLSDGIVYSVRDTVDAQIYCQKNTLTKGQKLTGAGIIYMPPGCTLTLTDQAGTAVRIKSPPATHLFETETVQLIPSGPAEIFQPLANSSSNTTNSVMRLINRQIELLDLQLAATTAEVESQNRIIIILGSTLGAVTLISILITSLLYRYSRRFRRKAKRVMEDLMTSLQDAKRSFVTFDQMAAHRARRDSDEIPLVPVRPHDGVVNHRGGESGSSPIPLVRNPAPIGVCSQPMAPSWPPTRRQNLSRHNSLKSILNQLAEFEMHLVQELLPDQSEPQVSPSIEGYTLPLGDPCREETSVYHQNETRLPLSIAQASQPQPPPIPPKLSLGARPKQPKPSRNKKNEGSLEQAHLALVLPKKGDPSHW